MTNENNNDILIYILILILNFNFYFDFGFYFFRNFILGMLFSTVVNAVFVAKLVISGSLFSNSVILVL